MTGASAQLRACIVNILEMSDCESLADGMPSLRTVHNWYYK